MKSEAEKVFRSIPPKVTTPPFIAELKVYDTDILPEEQKSLEKLRRVALDVTLPAYLMLQEHIHKWHDVTMLDVYIRVVEEMLPLPEEDAFRDEWTDRFRTALRRASMKERLKRWKALQDAATAARQEFLAKPPVVQHLPPTLPWTNQPKNVETPVWWANTVPDTATFADQQPTTSTNVSEPMEMESEREERGDNIIIPPSLREQRVFVGRPRLENLIEWGPPGCNQVRLMLQYPARIRGIDPQDTLGCVTVVGHVEVGYGSYADDYPRINPPAWCPHVDYKINDMTLCLAGNWITKIEERGGNPYSAHLYQLLTLEALGTSDEIKLCILFEGCYAEFRKKMRRRDQWGLNYPLHMTKEITNPQPRLGLREQFRGHVESNIPTSPDMHPVHFIKQLNQRSIVTGSKLDKVAIFYQQKAVSRTKMAKARARAAANAEPVRREGKTTRRRPAKPKGGTLKQLRNPVQKTDP